MIGIVVTCQVTRSNMRMRNGSDSKMTKAGRERRQIVIAFLSLAWGCSGTILA